MLEVGAGSGLISEYFANRHKGRLHVSAVDVVDQRVVRDGFDFQTYDGRKLPFDDGLFDLVVSNHVIEHVGSRAEQRAHLDELARVLSRGGAIYLAAPSRWQMVEPHFGLVALSWIPRPMRDGYVRLFRRGDRYDCNPLGHRELERMAAATGLRARNLNAQAFRDLCSAKKGRTLQRWLGSLPLAWLGAVYRASPTMVYLLTHQVSKK